MTLVKPTISGIAAGASAAVVLQSPFWLAVGSVAGLVVGLIAERRHGPHS